MVVMLKRFLAVLALGGLLLLLLHPALGEKKRAHWTRRAMLDLQRGLQSHLVEKEHYPMLGRAPAADLAEFLQATGHLAFPPEARWLRGMEYRSEGDFKNFLLTATRPGETNAWFRLDEKSSL